MVIKTNKVPKIVKNEFEKYLFSELRFPVSMLVHKTSKCFYTKPWAFIIPYCEVFFYKGTNDDKSQTSITHI